MTYYPTPDSSKNALRWIFGVESVKFDLILGQSIEWSFGMKLSKRERQIMFVEVTYVFSLFNFIYLYLYHIFISYIL